MIDWQRSDARRSLEESVPFEGQRNGFRPRGSGSVNYNLARGHRTLKRANGHGVDGIVVDDSMERGAGGLYKQGVIEDRPSNRKWMKSKAIHREAAMFCSILFFHLFYIYHLTFYSTFRSSRDVFALFTYVPLCSSFVSTFLLALLWRGPGIRA